MRIDLSHLNRQQYLAATQIKGPTLILAGAGTGKTQVLTFRIANMLASGITPESVLGVTFTNKAAKEMKERLAAIVGTGLAKRLTIGTFHSACLNIIRRYPKESGLRKNFQILDTLDQMDLLKKALEENNWLGTFDPRAVLSLVSHLKNKLLKPEDLKKSETSIQGMNPETMYNIYNCYERLLKLNNGVDFDDCISKTYHLLNEYPEIKQEVTSQYHYLLVDEFQDTNFAQLQIVRLLSEEHRNICVVGDDDQSIYSWRGAMYETFSEFESIFPESKIIKLEQNYRCATNILSAANTVIKNNPVRKTKTLWCDGKTHAPILLNNCANETAEASFIAQKCIGLLGKGYKPKDISVIYRANNQAKHIELALREHNIPYKTYGGQSFFDKKEIKDFFAYLRLVANPRDRIALWRVINTPHRGIGLKTIEKIDSLAQQHNISPFQVLEQNMIKTTASTTTEISQFVNHLTELGNKPIASGQDLNILSKELLDRFGLINDLRKTIKDQKSRQFKIENLKTLPDLLKNSADEMISEQGKFKFNQLIDAYTLSEAGQNDNKDEPKNTVSLMTIHASKGLEFPVVFICGLEDEQLPHKNSIQEKDGINEERRLFYVAITRAKHLLYLSYAQYRTLGRTKTARLPSRFLKELPDDESILLRQEDAAPQEESKEEKKKKVISKLSALRQSL